MRRTAAAILAAALLATPAAALEQKLTEQQPPVSAGAITVRDAWIKAEVGPQRMAAAYAVIENTGDTADALTGAETGIAEDVQLHTYLHRGPVKQMQRIARIPIGPGETAELRPDDRHIMLFGLQHPLDEENAVDITLVFEDAGRVTVTFEIRDPQPDTPLSAAVPEGEESREERERQN